MEHTKQRQSIDTRYIKKGLPTFMLRDILNAPSEGCIVSRNQGSKPQLLLHDTMKIVLKITKMLLS